jgi:hypothetical protein
MALRNGRACAPHPSSIGNLEEIGLGRLRRSAPAASTATARKISGVRTFIRQYRELGFPIEQVRSLAAGTHHIGNGSLKFPHASERLALRG